MTKAIALIAGPIVFAALFFHLETAGPRAGVYVEVGRGAAAKTFPLVGDGADSGAQHHDMIEHAVATPTGSVGAFVVVSDDATSAAKSAASVRLQLVVVDNADAAFTSVPLTVPSTTTSINPRVYRVTSSDLGTSATALTYYRDALSHSSGSRATLELLATLVVQDSSGQSRAFSVRIGPNP